MAAESSGNPLDGLWDWLKRNSFEGPDLLTGAPQREKALRLLEEGLTKARDSIRGAYGEAKTSLSPYAQAGQQDFNNYRNMVYGGHFDTPPPTSYQSPTYQNPSFSPGQWNEATQSFAGGGQSPYQTPQMNFAPLSLPQMPGMNVTQMEDFQKPAPEQMTPQKPPVDWEEKLKEIFGLSTKAQGPQTDQMLGRTPQHYNPSNPVQQPNVGPNLRAPWMPPDPGRGGSGPMNPGAGSSGPMQPIVSYPSSNFMMAPRPQASAVEMPVTPPTIPNFSNYGSLQFPPSARPGSFGSPYRRM